MEEKNLNECGIQQIVLVFINCKTFAVDSLPKTRSGKIMRRVLKAKALGIDSGNLSTLEE